MEKIGTDSNSGSDFNSIVTTGVVLEEQCFTWKIENFDVVRKSREMIQKQRFDFLAGDTVGLPSSWSCRLWYSVKFASATTTPRLPNDLVNSNVNSGVEWIGVFFHLEKFPEETDELTFVFNYTIYKDNGDVYYSLEVPVKCLRDVGDTAGWGKKCIIPKRANMEDLPLIDGSLVIHSKFCLYAPKQADPGILKKLTRFRTLSMQKLGMDLAASIQNGYSVGHFGGDTYAPSKNNTAIIISKDGQEFRVDRGFLAARSKVFQAMFLSQMQESQTGLIYLDDISSQTVRVLLHYIYTGILQDNWCDPDIIVEFTYAADKYELVHLLQFFDEALGSVCTKECAGKLLVLSSRLSLRKAEREIFTFIQRHATSTQELIAFAKDIAAADTNVVNYNPNCKTGNLIELSFDSL